MNNSHDYSLGVVITNISDRDSIDRILRAGVEENLQGQSAAYMEEKPDEYILSSTNTKKISGICLVEYEKKRSLGHLGANMNITHAASNSGC
ncbi:hypothetical protein H5410_027923 [Solanum commersonii]|uniref:Uncharacterized protein n=1 Tax=Solanum commersonii TaxID=4109 RepID=A0A9J5Z3H5_SOLCO|nr:hypothetical protein H5410_027923 [Solanum commersonii]